MEIEIENPGESKSEKVIHEFSMEENCLLGGSCNNGGICMETTTLPDLGVAKGTCVCPLGYSGKFCDQSKQLMRFFAIIPNGIKIGFVFIWVDSCPVVSFNCEKPLVVI